MKGDLSLLKILVTGGSGFLGPNICEILASEGHEVVSFDLKHSAEPENGQTSIKKVYGDVTLYESVLDCIKENPSDGIVAAAAKILGDQDDPLGTFRVNVLGVANVLEAARVSGVKKVVLTSTAGVYGKRSDPGALDEDLPMNPEDTYEHTKEVAENWVRTYWERYSLDVRVVRFPFLYGPRQYVVWPLNIVLYYALRGSPLKLAKGGDYPLEYLHVRDAANGTVLALEAERPPHRVFNIGTGKCVTVREVAKAVRSIFPSFDCQIGPGLWSSDVLNAWVRGPLDISRAEADLDYHPGYDIQRGIAELTEWEKAHPEEYLRWPKNDLWVV